MAEKVSRTCSRESRVGGLGVSIVWNLGVVTVFRALTVSNHQRSSVRHALTDARHTVFFSVGVVSCHLDAVSGLLCDLAGESSDLVIGILLVEVRLGHSHKLCSILGAGNRLTILGSTLFIT